MPEKFCEILRKTRIQKKMNQSDLAKKAGMQPSAISHFETGTRTPSFHNLHRLADALGVSIDLLLDREIHAGASGPAADQLFRNYEKLSESDQEMISDMAKRLADMNSGNSVEDTEGDGT